MRPHQVAVEHPDNNELANQEETEDNGQQKEVVVEVVEKESDEEVTMEEEGRHVLSFSPVFVPSSVPISP